MTFQPRQQAGTPNGVGGQYTEKTYMEAGATALAGPTIVGNRTVSIPGRLQKHPDVEVTFFEKGLVGLETDTGYVEISAETLDALINARREDQEARHVATIHVGLRVDTAMPGLGRQLGEVVALKQDGEYVDVRLDDRGRTLTYRTTQVHPV